LVCSSKNEVNAKKTTTMHMVEWWP